MGAKEEVGIVLVMGATHRSWGRRVWFRMWLGSKKMCEIWRSAKGTKHPWTDSEHQNHWTDICYRDFNGVQIVSRAHASALKHGVWFSPPDRSGFLPFISKTLGLGYRISNSSVHICPRSRSEIPLAHTLQEGRTPLHHASKEGKEAVVAALLETKADVNSTDKVRRIAIGTFTCRCKWWIGWSFISFQYNWGLCPVCLLYELLQHLYIGRLVLFRPLLFSIYCFSLLTAPYLSAASSILLLLRSL